ncbi:MAG: hypothetical protein JO297_11660 [Nitrososphaeraceae archaeon]|nr:hypothetical protein [Nitrososphaeraceae archaeon]
MASKLHTFLSNAISIAEKTVAANSHTTSDRLMLERRLGICNTGQDFTNNNLHTGSKRR